MGGVVNVVTKSGTQRSCAARSSATRRPTRSKAAWKTFQSANGTVNTVGTGRSDVGVGGRLPAPPEPPVLLRRHQPGVGEAHVHRAPTASRCRASAKSIASGMSLSYSGKATWQAAAAHRFDVSFFGDPAKGDLGPQRTSSLAGHRHVVVQRARVTAATTRRCATTASCRRTCWSKPAPPAPSTRSPRCRRSTPGASPTRRWCPTSSPAASAPTRRATRARTTSTPPRPPGCAGGHQVKVGGLFEDVEYAAGQPAHRPDVHRRDGRQTETGASISIIADPTLGRIYRVTRANFNSARTTRQDYWSLFVQDTWESTIGSPSTRASATSSRRCSARSRR